MWEVSVLTCVQFRCHVCFSVCVCFIFSVYLQSAGFPFFSHIFKLSQGEYIAVEKVEAAYMRCPLVSQTFVYGDSFKSKLVMVLVPEADEFVIWASVKGMRGSMKELCAKPEVVDAFFEHLNNLDYVKKLKGFETVKAIYAEGDVNDMGQGFSIENNCMTPTFKLRRPQLKERYQSQIDTMYASLGE